MMRSSALLPTMMSTEKLKSAMKISSSAEEEEFPDERKPEAVTDSSRPEQPLAKTFTSDPALSQGKQSSVTSGSNFSSNNSKEMDCPALSISSCASATVGVVKVDADDDDPSRFTTSFVDEVDCNADKSVVVAENDNAAPSTFADPVAEAGAIAITALPSISSSDRNDDDTSCEDSKPAALEGLKVAATATTASAPVAAVIAPTSRCFTSDLEAGVMEDEYSKAAFAVATNVKSLWNCHETRPGPIAVSGGAGGSDDLYTYRHSSPMLTAQLVSDSIEECERQRIIEETMQNMTDQAVSAEVVSIDDDDNDDDDESQVAASKHRIILRNSAFALILLLTLVAAISTLVMVRPTSVPPQAQADATDNNASSPTAAPTAPPTSYAEGGSAFKTTEQLYKAVDAYLASLAESDTAPESSSVALRYGFPIGMWNVSLITNFTRVFDPVRSNAFDENRKQEFKSTFNEDLSGWDVSNAVTMFAMFAGATGFVGQGLDAWDVGNVKDFSFAFMDAKAFNASLSAWNTASAVSMEGMFLAAESFDGDLSRLDVSNVEAMQHMFQGSSRYKGGDLTSWNVSKVGSMSAMFQNAVSFTGDVSAWDTSRVTDMSMMFWEAASFNGDLSSWSVGNVLDMEYMFASAISFVGGDLSGWDTRSVDNMYHILDGSEMFEGDVSKWNVAAVEDFGLAFSGCSKFDGDLSLWNTSNAVYMDGMFSLAENFTGGGLSGWSTSNVVNMAEMFLEARSFSGDLSSWDTSNVKDTHYMFSGAEAFDADLSGWNLSYLEDASFMFSGALSFNQTLCNWNKVLSRAARVEGIFEGSGCFITADPVPSDWLSGPFCTVCSQ